MDVFGQEIQRLKHAAEALSGKVMEQSASNTAEEDARSLFEILLEFANHACLSDSDLNIKVTCGSKPKLVAGFLDAHFSTPRYTLSSDWTGEIVTLTVSDGNWTEAANYLGLWGSWTDAKTIFAGRFLESAVREAIERTFLAWYQSVKSNRLSGLN